MREGSGTGRCGVSDSLIDPGWLWLFPKPEAPELPAGPDYPAPERPQEPSRRPEHAPSAQEAAPALTGAHMAAEGVPTGRATTPDAFLPAFETILTDEDIRRRMEHNKAHEASSQELRKLMIELFDRAIDAATPSAGDAS
jgi:hypothetical protein